LLQILLPELEQVVAEDDELGKIPSSRDLSDRISATARRILACLRQYSSWLVSNASHLVALENHEVVGVQITEFWRIYANALTLLAATFQKSDLPSIDYLLEEDEDTIAFTPFTNSCTLSRFYHADGVTLKPRSRDQTVQRYHPSVEMLFRVRGLLEDGVALVTRLVCHLPSPCVSWKLTDLQNESSQTPVPLIIVEDARFEFKEKGLPSEPSFNKSHSHSHSAASINRDDIERAKRSSMPSRRPTDIPEDASESLAPSVSTNTTMRRMVDGLVASEVSENHEPNPHFPQISHGESPPTPTVDGFEDAAYEDLKSGTKSKNGGPMDNLENIRPMLPSIWNSPFAPRPGETESPHTRPSTAHRHAVVPSTGTPPATSSNTMFQEALLRQQQELEMQQSSIYDLPTTASTLPASSCRNTTFLGREASPAPSPFASSPSLPSAAFPSYDVPRNVAQQPRFGAIGEIPPSGQGG
jgi:Est1 DNA/RNA binding domain